jgi:hypothetical protein
MAKQQQPHGPPMTLGNMRGGRPYRSGRSPDWIKVKNPDAPAATRLIEGSHDEPILHH